MQPASNTKSPPPFWVRSHLDLAQAVLALQHEVMLIKAELARRTTTSSGRRSTRINWKAATEWLKALTSSLKALGEVIATPPMQILITGLMPLLVAIGKAILRWLTG